MRAHGVGAIVHEQRLRPAVGRAVDPPDALAPSAAVREEEQLRAVGVEERHVVTYAALRERRRCRRRPAAVLDARRHDHAIGVGLVDDRESAGPERFAAVGREGYGPVLEGMGGNNVGREQYGLGAGSGLAQVGSHERREREILVACAGLAKQAHDFATIVCPGPVEWRVSGATPQVRVGAPLEEQLDNVSAAVLGSVMERCPCVPVSPVYVEAVREEQLGDLDRSARCSRVEQGTAVLVRHPHVDAAVGQVAEEPHQAAPGGVLDELCGNFRVRRHRCAAVEQQIDQIVKAAPRGETERRVAEAVLGVHVGPAIEQPPGHLDFARLARDEE